MMSLYIQQPAPNSAPPPKKKIFGLYMPWRHDDVNILFGIVLTPAAGLELQQRSASLNMRRKCVEILRQGRDARISSNSAKASVR
jgi:hypothetical protein